MDGQWQARGIATIVVAIMAIFGIYLAGPVVTDFIDWFFDLFRTAGFYSERAISAFVQLIAVVLTGCWAYMQIRK